MIFDIARAVGIYAAIINAALLFAAIAAGLGLLWLAGRIVYRLAIDAIEIWARWQSAKADARRRPTLDRLADKERRDKFLLTQEQARQQLSDHRLRLRAGYVPQAAGYVMQFVAGETDIEIEDVKR